MRNAWAYWSTDIGLWELETTHDQALCQNCEATTELVWSCQELPPNQRIRELNDRFRTTGQGCGSIMLTSGIQEMGGEFAVAVVKAVREFDDFSDDNDPSGEHDFGPIEMEGEKVLFKIDYYDPTLQQGSENPTNEGCTLRVLTIMLASEYQIWPPLQGGHFSSPNRR